jgi:hypothetical protein
MKRHPLRVPVLLVAALALTFCAPPRRGSTTDQAGDGDGNGDGGNGDGGNNAEGEGEGASRVDPEGEGEGEPAEGEGEPAEGEGEPAEGEGEVDSYCGDGRDFAVPEEDHHPTPCEDEGLSCESPMGCKPDRDNAGEYKCDRIGLSWETQGCSDSSNCRGGLMCVNQGGPQGSCIRVCVTDDHCPGDRACDGSSINDQDNNFLTDTCGAGPSSCDPLCSEAHCNTGQGCYLNDGSASCLFPSDDASEWGGSCMTDETHYSATKCMAGGVCVQESGEVMCRQVCNTSVDDPDAECPGEQICVSRLEIEFPDLGTCNPP